MKIIISRERERCPIIFQVLEALSSLLLSIYCYTIEKKKYIYIYTSWSGCRGQLRGLWLSPKKNKVVWPQKSQMRNCQEATVHILITKTSLTRLERCLPSQYQNWISCRLFWKAQLNYPIASISRGVLAHTD